MDWLEQTVKKNLKFGSDNVLSPKLNRIMLLNFEV